MQRLFSMFPGERPGVALLLMRIALAVMVVDGVGRPWHLPDSPWLTLVLGVLACALGLGLLTPLAAVSSALLQLMTWSGKGTTIEAIHACVILVAVALALLGPGAYSLDARIFGRRKVNLPDPDSR